MSARPGASAVLAPSVAEIGSTWCGPSAQRTGINQTSSCWMLSYAFEVWRVLRVTLETDARNSASR